MPRQFTASISFMFRELPMLERFAAAKAVGFDGVEIQVLAEADPSAMADAAAAAGIDVVLINVGMGDYLDGGLGLSGVPGREETFRAAIIRAFEAAALLGARFVHLGPSRIPDKTSRERCLDVYAANAEAALGLARGLNFSLLLEPMNPVDAPTALFNRVDDAVDVLRSRFDGRIGLLFDLYHMAMGGEDLIAAAHRHRDWIRHVQFSDAPGRHEPGTGGIDFLAAFAALEAAGYSGRYGAEYFPGRPTGETLGWLPGFKRGGAIG